MLLKLISVSEAKRGFTICFARVELKFTGQDISKIMNHEVKILEPTDLWYLQNNINKETNRFFHPTKHRYQKTKIPTNGWFYRWQMENRSKSFIWTKR